MQQPSLRVRTLLSFIFWMSFVHSVHAESLQREFVTTTPVYSDGFLYVASHEYPVRRGHLHAIDIIDTFPLEVWDAAELVPLAGSDLIQPADIWSGNQRRFLLTNLTNHLQPLEAAQATSFSEEMLTASPTEAALVIHAIRGRRGGTLESPAGNREEPYRLFGISKSSPVLVGKSVVNSDALQRDQVIYVGAEDGLLHAFLVRQWDDRTRTYPLNDQNNGTELWAYLPGSFLPYIKTRFLDDLNGESVIHLDGTPVVKEVFSDLDGDGRRSWQTLLVGTGTINPCRRSCLFVLDITNPYQPELLWENLLPGDGIGRTRGVTVGACAGSDEECLYLTTDYRSTDNAAGLHVLAIEMLTGELRWQFSRSYSATGDIVESTPATPSLMDMDQDNQYDTLVLGDLAGQIWAIKLSDGLAYTDAPLFTVPGSFEEPIGAAVAVHGNLVVFGTGGIAGADDQGQYALYKIRLSPERGELLWRFPLEVGSRVWAAPLLDTDGNVIFSASTDYESLLNSPESTSGTILALDKDGEKVSEHEAGGVIIGRVISANGLVVSASVTGQVKQFGNADRLTGPDEDRGSVRILSWRQR